MSQKNKGKELHIEPHHKVSNNIRKYASLDDRRQAKNAKRRKLTATINIIDPLDQIVNSPDVLPAAPDCKFCNAKRIHLEPPSFCCCFGEVKLASTEMPLQLLQLYLSNSEDGTHFRDCIRSYNNMFAFTSIGGGHCDDTLATRNQGIYTYRIQGQLYHQVHQLKPPDEHPKYLQLYYYDTDNEITNRLSISPKFREILVTKLIDILQQNPYSTFFRNLNTITNLDEYRINLYADPNYNPNVFNKPTVSQVAALWLESDSNIQTSDRNIRIYSKDHEPQFIKQFFGCYDSMQYPLIFANGESGWHRAIDRLSRTNNTSQHTCNDHAHDIRNYTNADAFLEHENHICTKKTTRTKVSCRQYYCYKLQVRQNDKSFLLHTGRLLQQYVVDMYIKIETSRLQFFRSEEMQCRLRNEVYNGVLDGIAQGCQTGSDIGKRFMLPSSFIGGPRDMRKRYMDAIALVRHYGKPDIFLTITANPNWPEIKSLCFPSDEIQNRPDLVARVFRSKLEVLKKELFKKKIFGEVIAYTYVIEFQKRGLPHAHFLLILSRASKMFTAEAFDRIVSAEIPDPQKEPYLFSLVIKHMLHGPCGIYNPTCGCMRNNFCKFNYPKEFSDSTKLGSNSYPIYRRRNNGFTVTIRGTQLDNRWVSPYNRYLLAKFNCHLNVEICSTIQAVKYIYKYIYKGHDKILYSLLPNTQEPVLDEITTFQQARWISPPEAMWRIFSFDLNQMHPSVICLPLHLQNQQSITFPANQSLESIAKNTFLQRTMLTQFFNMNKYNDYAKCMNCLYIEFPQYFTWHSDSRKWEPRKKNEVIGRIVSCSPFEGERFYLRLLLMHVKKPTSFEDLRTVNRIIYSTYRDAAKALGLMEADDTIEMCLHEASTYTMPAALRQLFATILIYCNPQNPTELFSKFEHFLSEDFKQDKTLNPHTIRYKVLDSLTYLLHSMGKRIEDFLTVDHDTHLNSQDSFTRELETERNIVVSTEDLLAVNKLNEAQKFAYDRILHHVNNNSPRIFFVDGPGGTGKTFLYKALLATIRSTGGIVLATATSGVAASLLPGGRTSHSRFKIPLRENDSKCCSISKQSTLAYLIKVAKLIIWDEATMAKRNIIEKFDEMLRDIMSTNIMFGGKIVVFGGDFRQTLPVIINGTKQDIINSTIVMSPLWNHFEKLKLTQNMRALLDPDFSAFLLKVGDGTEVTNSHEEILIPSNINLDFTDEVASLNLLIDMVFPEIDDNDFNVYSFTTRAILTTRNEFVHEINDALITRFRGEQVTYFACDQSVNSSHLPDQQDLFHTLTPTGLPPHRLILKKNAPIILLRNVNPSEGLCNGTRLICKAFDTNMIYAEISAGSFAGKSVFIPRITLESPEDSFSSIPFQRKQFPVRLCFAMTINKAQGQTLDFVGVYLKEPVFSHGQLYVALSRAKTIDKLKVLIRPATSLNQPTNYTKNVVYKEVLMAANT